MEEKKRQERDVIREQLFNVIDDEPIEINDELIREYERMTRIMRRPRTQEELDDVPF